MAYRLRYSINVDWIGDGAGPMEVASAQTRNFIGTQPVPFVPGADAPTAANFQTALNSAATDIGNQIAVAAVLAQLQGFATGGG